MSTLLLLGEPFSFVADGLIARDSTKIAPACRCSAAWPAACRPGENRLLFGGRAIRRHGGRCGARPRRAARSRASSRRAAGRSAGRCVVTKAEKNVILELGGSPAWRSLQEVFGDAPSREQQTRPARPARRPRDQRVSGRIPPRRFPGPQRDRGRSRQPARSPSATSCASGQTVQFHVRDAETADEDLRELCSPAGGEAPATAGRGAALHLQRPRHAPVSRADHDVGCRPRRRSAPCRSPASSPKANSAPSAGKNFLHGFTASIGPVRRALSHRSNTYSYWSSRFSVSSQAFGV